MNRDQIQGNWKQVMGKVQERYGIAKDDAEKRFSGWQRKASDAWFPKNRG